MKINSVCSPTIFMDMSSIAKFVGLKCHGFILVFLRQSVAVICAMVFYLIAFVERVYVMSEEKSLWVDTPSQASNLLYFIVCGVFFWMIFPLFLILWRWLQTKSTKYELSNERLITRYGVLNKKTDELELYRVKDYQFEQPLLLRIFSLGNIILTTSDRSDTEVVIHAIEKGEALRETIRSHVEACRSKKRVREVDFE